MKGVSKTRKTKTYGDKKASGQMMYGPGCCANEINVEEVRNRRIKKQR